jgi:hypothetical protein
VAQHGTPTEKPSEVLRSDPATFLEHSNVFSALPKRRSSLRKTTLQQRYGKPPTSKLKASSDVLADA